MTKLDDLRLEKHIERTTGKLLKVWARGHDMHLLFIKLSTEGTNGIPDRLILWDGGLMFVEFKRTDKKPRALQLYVLELLRKLGFEARVYDNVTQSVAEITAYIQSHRKTTGGGQGNTGGSGVSPVPPSGEGENRDRTDSV